MDGIRIFKPCVDPAGANCTLFDEPETLHMAETRWYPSSLRIFDGSLVLSYRMFPMCALQTLSMEPPLSPPLFIHEALTYGGTTTSDQIQPANLSFQDPATSHRTRLMITPEGVQK